MVDRDLVYSEKPVSVTLNVIEDPRNYMTRYRGTYLYLDRYDYGTTNAICRLKYTDSIKDWEFAIFKYLDNVKLESACHLRLSQFGNLLSQCR